jgi:hypothetical protein
VLAVENFSRALNVTVSSDTIRMEEENVRELRSSRSRSATPFFRASRDRDSTHVAEDARRVISTTQTKGR